MRLDMSEEGYGRMSAVVLDGELAVPCTRNPL